MENQKIHHIFIEYLNYERTITEATNNTKNSIYVGTLSPGYREFEKNINSPFTEFVNDWDDASIDHDSLDGKLSQDKKTITKREKKAERISKFIKNNPDSVAQEAEGGLINSIPKKIDAVPIKNFDPKKTVVSLDENSKNKIKEDSSDGKCDNPKELKNQKWDVVNEDLGVWFGTKKKPKGSKQPKGPWVNICRKDKDGKHPPCGRPEADSKGYPKCRAAGVAGKMPDAQKKSACAQKRRAEKKHDKTGTGNKPVMVSHKNKKTNESVLIQLIRKYLD